MIRGLYFSKGVIETNNITLAHHGIKGQKWGVQNGPPYPLGASKDTYSINRDGSIKILKGAIMQRVVDENSEAAKKKKLYPGMNYASFTSNDNAKYIVATGGEAFKGANRDALLKLKVKKDLKSPSTGEASRIYFQMLKDNPQFAKKAGELIHDKAYTEKELDALIQYSKRTNKPHNDYFYANYCLIKYGHREWDKITNTYFDLLKKNGYNLLRDENDTRSGLARNPVIVLDSANCLSVESVTHIDSQMRKNAQLYVDKYSGKGRIYLRSLGFPVPLPRE